MWTVNRVVVRVVSSTAPAQASHSGDKHRHCNLSRNHIASLLKNHAQHIIVGVLLDDEGIAGRPGNLGT